MIITDEELTGMADTMWQQCRVLHISARSITPILACSLMMTVEGHSEQAILLLSKMRHHLRRVGNAPLSRECGRLLSIVRTYRNERMENTGGDSHE